MHKSTLVRIAVRLLASLTFFLWAIFPAQADQAEWERLGAEVLMHLEQGRYEQATASATQGLHVAEDTFGPNHTNVAMTLNMLASLYRDQGQYAQAEPLYKRALGIYEKALGPDHPDVAQSLSILAGLLQYQGQYAQAEPLYKRSLSIKEKALGPEHPSVALSLNNLALLYSALGQWAQAEPLYKRSLSIIEKTLGQDHPDVATILGNLAVLYSTQGQYAQAEPLCKRSLSINEKSFGSDHPAVAKSLNNLAGLHQYQGQYAQAEPLYKRALGIYEKALGLDHPDVAQTLNNFAELYRTQGQYAQAEPLYKRALGIYEKALGPDHPDVAQTLNNLAELYRTQGQYVQAELLNKRALSIYEKALGPDHPAVAKSLNNLALIYYQQSQYDQAEPLYKRSLSILGKSLGSDHPDLAKPLGNLALIYYTHGQYAQAEPLYKRSLSINEKALGLDHPNVALSLHNLAFLYSSQGQYAQAEPLYKRSLSILEKSLGSDHPDVANSLNNLAELHQNQGQYAQALSMSRKASTIYRHRIVAGGTGEYAALEASKNRLGFLLHLSLLSRNPGKEGDDKIADEAFQIVQLQQASGTASAIAKMAARFATGNDALSSLVKRKQDAGDRRIKGESQLVAAVSKMPQERNALYEKRLREDVTLAEKEIGAIDEELMRRFPEYQELTRAEPITVNQVRALLKSSEAMLVYELGESSYLWVVKKDTAIFMPLQVKKGDVATKVAIIRAEMEFNDAGKTQRVSIDVLHELYRSLFAPAMPHLAGVQHVMVVPAGPLQSLPFGMLVASPPPTISSNADYRKVDWLVKHYALSVLPAVSSIKAFRQFAKPGNNQEPFAGFGDPLIGKSDGATHGKKSKLDIATAFRKLVLIKPLNAPVQAAAFASEIADVEELRNASRLPETAGELRAMAKVLKSGEKSLWLQANATETKVKGMDLSRYQTIAFATHGVMAGEVKGVGESGLVLTPPKQGTTEDDGYLSAGEIAKLKLNADWVVLSACNTAAADGTPGAEGLSGLAKAFFYAGARSLLVSHWPVASEATVPLTTKMLSEYKDNPGLGKAEAHRRAMLALMSTPNHPEYAHPIYWAPFVVVGEGGQTTR